MEIDFQGGSIDQIKSRTTVYKNILKELRLLQ